MAMETRIYVITHKKSGVSRMVDSPTSAAALKKVASDEYSVEVGKAKDTARLASEGVKVESLTGQVQTDLPL